MFEWIDAQLSRLKATGREHKIRRAFPAYEAAKRTEHIQTSLRKFSTQALEQELHKKLAKVREEIRTKYSTPIAIREKEIALLQREISHINAELAILQHSYKADLDPLYAALASLAADMKAAQVAKQDAYSRLEKAKERINHWHAKSKRSPFLFGNGGAALPNHSLFGQSFGDLDGYKSERSSAANDIQKFKNTIAILQNQRDEVSRKISVVKASRQKMFDLRQQGRSVKSLQSALTRQLAKVRELSDCISNLRSESAKVLEAERYRTGAIEIERIILAIKLKRDDFVQSFDTPEASTARFAAHIEDWINAHGS